MFLKKQPKIGREAMFKSKPVRNDQVEWEKNDDGEIHVTLTRGDSWKVRTLSKIFWIPKTKTLVLDEIGAQVWDMCDGRTTVEAIIKTPEQNPPTQSERSRNLVARLSQKARAKGIARVCRCQKRPARQQATQACERQGMGMSCTGSIDCDANFRRGEQHERSHRL